MSGIITSSSTISHSERSQIASASRSRAKPGEAFWAASDVGWVVGHSYIVYAPLLVGCTTIVFEGDEIVLVEGFL